MTALPLPRFWRRRLDLPAEWRRALPSMVSFVLLEVLLFRDALQGGVFFQRDIHLLWQPTMEVFVRTVSAGAWPVWNPYVCFGQPLLANPTSQIFYPLTWLNMVMPTWTYYKLFVFVHLFWGACGAALLGRRIGLGRAGATLAGALWMTSGPLLSLVNVWAHLSGAAWMPWSAIAIDHALARRSGRAISLGAAALAAPLLAGSPEMTVAGALAGLLLGLPRFASMGHPPRPRVRVAMLAAGVGVAVGSGILAACQLMPAAELVSRSGRAALDASTRLYWSVHPWSLLELLLPLSASSFPIHTALRESLFEGRESYLGSLYVGVPVLALSIAALLGRTRPLKWALAGIVLLLAILSLGRHLPFVSAVLSTPPLQAFRYPVKALVPLSLALSLLGGLGFESLCDEVGRPGWRRALLVAFLLLAALAMGGAAWLFVNHAEEWGSVALLREAGMPPFTEMLGRAVGPLASSAGVTAVCAAVLMLTPSKERTRVAAAALIALLAVADLWHRHATLNPTAPAGFFAYRSSLLPLLRLQAGERLFVFDYSVPGASQRYLHHPARYVPRNDPGSPWATALMHREYPTPNVVGVWGVEAAFEHDLINLYPIPVAVLAGFRTVAEGTPAQRRLLRLGSVRTVLSLHEETFEDLRLRGAVESPFIEPIRVFEVEDTLPRAYAVSGTRIADAQAAVRVLQDPGFDPAREVVLPDGQPHAPVDGFHGTCRRRTGLFDRVDLECTLSHDGYVVLSDSWDPGWRGMLDGVPIPILRGNYAFRAVATPAGSHRIEMVYRPRPLLWGLAISAAGWLAVGSAWLVPGRRQEVHT